MTSAKKTLSLQELIISNSSSCLSGADAVYCGTCKRNTCQTSSHSYENTVFILELIRVSAVRGTRKKNSSIVNIPLSGIALPGCSISYRPVATAHHLGLVDSGHWISRIMLDGGHWIECDDLKARYAKITMTNNCMTSNSVVLVMLVPDSIA